MKCLERSYGSNRSNEREIEGFKLPYRVLLCPVSPCVAGGFLVVVFAPGEPDDQNVKGGQQQERDRMRVEESVNLKDGKEAEYHDRQGVGPQRVEPESRHQKRFDEPVGQQIERREVLASVSEVFGGPVQMRGYEFMAIEGEVDLKKFERDAVQVGGLNRPQHDAADGFENAVDPFERDSGSEAFVQQRTAAALDWMGDGSGGIDGYGSFLMSRG